MRIRSTRVVTPEGIRAATVVVEGEQITAVDPYGDADVDYGDLAILPGLVDSHVHVNEPGRTEWEGFETLTAAAAAGGVTTIVDMPLNSIPSTTTVEALRIKQEALAGKCSVDVALWGGVVPGNVRELKPMIAAGARGFKCFLIDSGVAEFPHVNERELREAAHELAGTGVPLLVHAELPGPIEGAGAALAGADPAEYGTWLHSRPPHAEDEAIELLLRVCEESGARIHVVHLSSAGALSLIAEARDRRLPLTAETTPHYLHFDAEQVPRGRTEFKCAPPIREHTNREQLWRGLTDGLLDIIVSDHSPCTPALKAGSFNDAWGGIASVQLILPVIWTEARTRGFELEALARWLSAGPARLAGLKTKGAIAPRADADLCIFDPDETFVVTPEIIRHRHKVTPYLGETLHGTVKATWLRGRPINPESEGSMEPQRHGRLLR
ncbi:MAG TPA: allantoinase AllB [Thermoanaerobaculia bacterium]|jgi:allantoinase